MADDGPLLRATMAMHEKQIHSLRSTIKAVLRELQSIAVNLKATLDSQATLDHLLLVDLAQLSTSSNSKQLDQPWYGSLREDRARQRRSRSNEVDAAELLIERLQAAYERLKTLEAQKKSFGSASETYYDHVDKYLSLAKADAAYDEKQTQRTTAYDVQRIGYLGFLEGVIASEESSLKSFIDSWISSSAQGAAAGGEQPDTESVGSFSPGGEGDTPMLAAAGGSRERDGDKGKRERFKEMIKSHLSPTTFTFAPPPTISLSPTLSSSALQGLSSLPPILDPARPSLSRKREGFLWATNQAATHSNAGDGGGSWHKFWCVLSHGQLIEYSHWRSSLDVRSCIDLRLASVRTSSPHSSSSDRRFTFEVLTPRERRVYQSISAQETQMWVQAITMSIESLLVGNSSMRVFDDSRLTGSDAGLLSLKAFASASTPSLVPTPLFLGSSGSSNGTGGGAGADAAMGGASGGLAALSNRLLGRRVSTGARRLIGRSDKDRSSASHAMPSSTSNSLLVPSASSSSSSVPPSFIYSTAPPKNDQQQLGRHARSASHSSLGTLSSSSPSSTLSEADRQIAILVNDFADSTLSNNVQRSHSTGSNSKDHKVQNGIEIERLAQATMVESGCAECAAKETNWASFNLGIFVCIRCSGIHRSLGTHISKVRSILLDDWSDAQMEKMRSVGNIRSNEYWEARKPTDFVLDEALMAEFIRSKYVDKIWIPPSSSSSDLRLSPLPTAAASGTLPALSNSPVTAVGRSHRTSISITRPFNEVFKAMGFSPSSSSNQQP